MKPFFRSFEIFIRQILRDDMLWAVCIAPMLTAGFFRFGIPYIESLLCRHFQQQAILADYYLLFDLLLSLITPYMFCYASAMVMLTEYDENMTSYMAVTPVGKKGYILSRLIFPVVISFFVSILLMCFFTLTFWTFWIMMAACLLTSFLSVAVALFLFSFSRNRVEGMAMAKMSGLLMAGFPAPFFLKPNIQYLFSPLPSFWIAKLCMERSVLFLLFAMLTILIWIWPLYRKFDHKLM